MRLSSTATLSKLYLCTHFDRSCGRCPVGRMAEDGPINDVYSLTEIGGGYRQRTKKNVIDSDGTAIFYESYVRGGTEATILFCIRQGKPYKLIDIALVDPL